MENRDIGEVASELYKGLQHRDVWSCVHTLHAFLALAVDADAWPGSLLSDT